MYSFLVHTSQIDGVILHFLRIFEIFSEYFSTTGKKNFTEKFFADFSDNFKKMKKKISKKNFSKKIRKIFKFFLIFLNCLERLQKNFRQIFFPGVEKYSEKISKITKKVRFTTYIYIAIQNLRNYTILSEILIYLILTNFFVISLTNYLVGFMNDVIFKIKFPKFTFLFDCVWWRT
jgi:hypothetical protein